MDVKDKNGETPLFLAVRNGHKDIIEVLLERGANPEISDACGVKLIDSICDQSRFNDQLNQGLALFTIMSILSMVILQIHVFIHFSQISILDLTRKIVWKRC